MSVRKAVIPAAGLGTRFLPATKSQPKEMLPVIDKPGIQYVVEEAVRAGLDDILIVVGRGKGTIADHFDASPELERHLEAAGKYDELEQVRAVAALADVHYVRQKRPRGFGDAVLQARRHVGDAPFIVMVPDEIVPEVGGAGSLLERLIAIYEQRGESVIAVQPVAPEEISAYGAIDPEMIEDDVARIRSIVEKPPPNEAPSTLAARGRYVFTSDLFPAIEATGAGIGGEVQLTDAIDRLAKGPGCLAYVHDGPIFDVGKKLDYLRATVELALQREDLAKHFKEFLAERIARPD